MALNFRVSIASLFREHVLFTSGYNYSRGAAHANPPSRYLQPQKLDGWSSSQNRNPPSSVPTPSRGLHHLERFALFIVKYDKKILLSSPHHYEVKKWHVFFTFDSSEILPQLQLIL